MEKRKYKRINSNSEIKIVNASKDEKVKIDLGKSKNVSACGVLVQYDKQLEIGQVITTRFLHKNSEETFESDARVVRIELNPDNKSFDIGIEFLNLNENQEQELDEYLLNDDQEKDYCFIEIEIPQDNKDKSGT